MTTTTPEGGAPVEGGIPVAGMRQDGVDPAVAALQARVAELEAAVGELREEIDETRRDGRRVAELYDLVFERLKGGQQL